MKPNSPFHGMLLIVLAGGILGVGFNLINYNSLPWIPKEKSKVTWEDVQGDSEGERSRAADSGAHGGAEAATRTGDAESLDPAIPESEFPIEIRSAEAKSLYDRGMLVLDARERAEYAAGHIRGAELSPVDEVLGDLEWLDRVAADPRPILVYCGGGDCDISLDLALELTQAGHRRVLVLLDGYPGWEEAGFPVSRGDNP